MDQVAIISIDGHVKAPRACRDYLERKHLDAFDDCFDMTALQPHIDRVGFELADLGMDAV